MKILQMLKYKSLTQRQNDLQDQFKQIQLNLELDKQLLMMMIKTMK